MSMNITFESRGDFNELTKWLESVQKSDPTVELNQIAREGERALSAATPRDSGETASGWRSKVVKGKVLEVVWYNVAHPHTRVSVARLIDLGHGTGTGGYVPAKPYIAKAMDPVWKSAGDRIAKGLTR